jgi:predicted ATPase
MITKVVVENFKRFGREEFDLDETVVLAGPNNSGKSTLLQALSTWSLALERWRIGKGRAGAQVRTGQPVTRKDFTALPLREFSLLWNKGQTGLSKTELGLGQKPGEPRLIHITVNGTRGYSNNQPWSLTIELRYQSTEQIYVKPILPTGALLPQEADDLFVVHCPPFSGIGAEEKRMDRGAQQLEIGRGKPGDILRNLLWEVRQGKNHWEELVRDIQDIFQITLLPPEYDESVPFILCEYIEDIIQGKTRTVNARYDIASAGSGFHQVLLLLSLFYARPASVLLLDEPDAHLHVILQHQVYDKIRTVASRRLCQLIIATHSEVVLDATPPHRVISFLGKPHRLVNKSERDQVREAMGMLTTLDLLLVEQGRAVLYCEGQSDFDILRAWAEVLDHPARRFFTEPFYHPIGGRSPRDARQHLFALRAIRPSVRGLLLLDGDNRGLPDHEILDERLDVVRWRRYEIENYLLVPASIERFLSPDPQDLFGSDAAQKALDYLRSQFTESFFRNPLSDELQAVIDIPASKQLLPHMFQAAGRALDKNEYYMIAECMKKTEIHPDIGEVLDRIASLRTE